jgi:hypothetical protein
VNRFDSSGSSTVWSLSSIPLSAIVGRFHIVAVAMEKLEVGELIFPALGTGKNMVNFQQIPVLKEQLAVSTFSLLSLQE